VRLETLVEIVFWNVTCSWVDKHQCYRAAYCLYLQGNVNMEESGFSEKWGMIYENRVPCFLLVGVTVQP
jgi:hypothetical protein